MENYIKDLNRLDAFEANHRMNRSARHYAAGRRYDAGVDFLERIHTEIFNDKPASEQEAIKADLKSLARGDVDIEEQYDVELVRPELTVEYLKSIGYDIDIA